MKEEEWNTNKIRLYQCCWKKSIYKPQKTTLKPELSTFITFVGQPLPRADTPDYDEERNN